MNLRIEAAVRLQVRRVLVEQVDGAERQRGRFRRIQAQRVLCVEDGEKLLAYLRECVASFSTRCMPALILLDLNMPRMDGREALRAIRSNPQFSNIPIVVLTTSSSEDDLRAARAAGCNDFVTKPATFSGLVDIAREISERWLGDSDHGVTRSE